MFRQIFRTTMARTGQNMSTYVNFSKNRSSSAILGSFTVLGATMVGFSYSQADQKKVDIAKVKQDIADLIDTEQTLGPTLVRLAWHSSGTFSKQDNSGGSKRGTIRLKPEVNHGANAGLDYAINRLEAVKAEHDEISYADLFVLAGVVAIEEMGGPSVAFRLGRSDAENGDECTPDGRLPDADKGKESATIAHIREIFYRMGFSDREIVALMGAHAIGRCYPNRSGYSGPWTRAEWTFSNEYFRELIENKWTVKKWNGPLQYEDPSSELMMLPADIALIQDPEFKKYVEIYAKDEDMWHKDFAAAFKKLTEAGVPFPKSGWRKYFFG